jgi:hypothetical protein
MSDAATSLFEETAPTNSVQVETAIQQAQQAIASVAPQPIVAMPKVKTFTSSTDPIPPIYHNDLIDNIGDITDYINVEAQKHKELMVLVDSLKEKLSAVSADLKNYHVEDKYAAIKKVVNKEKNSFLDMTVSQKIQSLAIVVVVIGIAVFAYKFV